MLCRFRECNEPVIFLSIKISLISFFLQISRKSFRNEVRVHDRPKFLTRNTRADNESSDEIYGEEKYYKYYK